MRFLLLPCTSISLLLSVVPPGASVWAQTTAGTIIGQVTDPQDHPVQSADLELVNQGTRARVKARTDTNGEYAFSNVDPGRYQVVVTAPGLQSQIAQDLALDVLETMRQNFKLGLETAKQALTVTAASPIIQTDSPTLSMVIDQDQIEQTPVNGRTDIYALMGLAPGVQRPNSNALIAGSSFTGGTTMTIDGMSMMDLFNSRMAGTPPSLEDIAEFAVVTNDAPAEFGRGGAQVIVETKAGTNDFHGSLFEFNRNGEFAARNFFLSPSAKNPPYNRNQFGGSFGGPIRRNRLFFFTAVEDLRSITYSVVQSAMPPTAFLTGNFSAYPQYVVNDPLSGAPFPGNQIPAPRISPIAQKFFPYFSAPNIPTSNGLGTNFTTVLPTFQKEFRLSERGDYTPTAKDRIMLRWFINNNGPYYSGSGSSSNLFGSFAGLGTRTWNIASDWTHVLSANIVNELTGGFNQEQDPRLDQNANVDPGSLVPGIPSPPPGHGGLPTIAISNLASITSAGSNFHNIHYITQLNDNLSIVRGKHRLKAGAQFLQQRTGQGGVNLGSFSFDGRYTRLNQGSVNAVNAFADFLLGDMYTDSAATSTSESRTRGNSMALYVQDDWQIAPNLTLNVGLRWEKSFVLTRTFAGASNFYPDMNGGELVTLTGTLNPLLSQIYPYVSGSSIGINLSNYTHTPDTDFGPRIGLAWRPLGQSRFVIRAGYALIYDYYPSYMNGLFQLPFYAVLTYNAAAGATPTLTFANPFPTNTISKGFPSLTGVPSSIPTPYQDQWNFSIEYEFLRDTALRVSYLGNAGVHLYIPYNINDPGQVEVPNGGSLQTYRPYPQWGTISEEDFSSNTNTNELQVGVRRRLSSTVTFDFEYSWTHALGIDGANDGAPNDPFNLRYDYGNLDFYRRQYLVIDNTWQLPFGKGRLFAGRIGNAIVGGWRFSGLFTAMSGQPLSVTFTPTLTGWEGTRANTVPDMDGPYANQTIHHWLNPAAFAAPAPYTYGDSARNAYFGPSYWELDTSLVKTISVRERVTIDIRGDAFNLLNHTDFSNPSANISNPSTFGQIISTANSARTLEFSARLKF